VVAKADLTGTHSTDLTSAEHLKGTIDARVIFFQANKYLHDRWASYHIVCLDSRRGPDNLVWLSLAAGITRC
jgi:hypothetical protein